MAKHLLYLTAEQWPTFRVDLISLFGHYLPRHGVTCDLVTERASPAASPPWPAGQALLGPSYSSKARQYASKFCHLIAQALKADPRHYAAIQVRDMPVVGALVMVIAKAKGLPFVYWMSYPHPEGQIDRARHRGLKAGLRYWFPLLQGLTGKWLLYKVVMPGAAHVFVQSDQMLSDVAATGIPREKLTAVPMAVDLAQAQPTQIPPTDDPRLEGRRVVVYLGTLDAARRIDILFDMVQQVAHSVPNVLLVLAGDVNDTGHKQWLVEQAKAKGIDHLLLWTGWLPMDTAWRYVRAAEVALSPFPRGFLLDSASPTKAVEYMALGIPVLVNDNPDQQQLVEKSGAGLCRPYTAAAFAEGVLELLALSPTSKAAMVARGQAHVAATRDYAILSKDLAAVYERVLKSAP